MRAAGDPRHSTSSASGIARRTRFFTAWAVILLLTLTAAMVLRLSYPMSEASKLQQVAPTLAEVQLLTDRVADHLDAMALTRLGMHADATLGFTDTQIALTAQLDRIEQIRNSLSSDIVPQSVREIGLLVASARELLAQDGNAAAFEQLQRRLESWLWLVSYNYVLPAVDQGKQKFLLVDHERMLLRKLRRIWLLAIADGVLSPVEQANLSAGPD